MRELCRQFESEGRTFVVRATRGLPDEPALPLCQRAPWLALSSRAPWVLRAHDAHGEAGVIAFSVTATRALPGHVVLRAERLWTAPAGAALVAAAAELARARHDILRVEIATFSFDPAERAVLRRALADQGYVRVFDERFYRRTACIDLRRDEAALLASFHPTARRHIRAVERHGVVVRPFTSEAGLAARLAELAHAAKQRTGGLLSERPFEGLLRIAAERPELVRFVGLFRDHELLAFASAHVHGDYATYADAGSVRRADIKLPLGYALAWELMRWAKQQGCSRFDFGGISDAPELRGISDFKRYFRGEELEVSEEWVFEPHRMRAAVAHTLSAAAGWWRSLQVG